MITTTVAASKITHWLHHPQLGELPARTLIDCVFALAPDGRILHFHKEELEISDREDERHHTPSGADARPERSRCQVIPPYVTAFPKRP